MINKKVLHVVNISFVTRYFFGGQFNYLKGLTSNVYYLACSPSEEHTKLSAELGYTAINLKVNRNISPLIDTLSIIKLIFIIKKYKMDVVIGHTPKGGMISMIASFLTGVKERIYFRHGIVYETSNGFRRILLKTIDSLSGILATKVVCVSNDVKKKSEVDNLNNHKKNIVLGLGSCNGVDAIKRFNPDLIDIKDINNYKIKLGIKSNDFVVGFVGRLVNDKGIFELIEAWKMFIKERPQSKLLLVGPLEERDGISNSLIEYIKKNPTIIVTGLVEDSQFYYSCMDILILPTFREGFPTVILEASSMKLPILVTKVTGCKEAIKENITGRFITHDIQNIMDNLIFYIDNPEIRKVHGENGRKFVIENFEQHKVWNEIHNVLKY